MKFDHCSRRSAFALVEVPEERHNVTHIYPVEVGYDLSSLMGLARITRSILQFCGAGSWRTVPQIPSNSRVVGQGFSHDISDTKHGSFMPVKLPQLITRNCVTPQQS